MTRDDRAGLWAALWSVAPALICWQTAERRFPRAPYSLSSRESHDYIASFVAVAVIFAASFAIGALWQRRHGESSGTAGTLRFLLRFAACELAAAAVLLAGVVVAMIGGRIVFGFDNPHTSLEEILTLLPPALAYSALLYPALAWSRPFAGPSRGAEKK